MEATGHRDRKDRLGLAVGVFQVAIGLASVSALTRRMELWMLGLAAGLGGVVFLLMSLR